MKPSWIAIDWGTSNLRIWAMGQAGEILEEKRSDQGMGSLAPKDYEAVLLLHIEDWLGDEPMTVLACGMVGARQGWFEAPYACAPCAPTQKTVAVPTEDPRLDVHIIAGIKQLDPADVMRGEETQIAGFLAQNPDYEGALCLPGTHSKWVAIEGGQITRFQTALTGELFALLSEQSVLRHSLGTWDDECFVKTVQFAFAHPEESAVRFFEIRAKNLLEGDDCGVARISGALIGSEIAGMRRFWENSTLTIIGAGGLARLYELALETRGIKAQTMRASTLTLDGLSGLYQEQFAK